MHRRFVVMGLVVVLLAAACGDDDTVQITPDGPPTAVSIGADQMLEVQLEGNPTTGYTWEVAEEGVVTLVESTHQPDSDLEGSPGITTLRFEPKAAGSGDLVLIYHRAWEEGVEPLETRTITVTVTR